MSDARDAVCFNPDAPLEERIEDLLSRMTLAEKVSQMRHESPAIPRLGVPEYNWWNECLHGVGRAGRATVFPQAIGLGATFDTDLIRRVAESIAVEARAKHHAAVRAGNRGHYRGLTFWTPTINIFRDPRWGRGQESYGEDPYLMGEIGAAFVTGLQGEDRGRMKASACAKHFAVHSGPEEARHRFDAKVSDRDLRETYLPAFKRLAEAGVEAFMGAYNRVNGEPACAHGTLLVDILRGEWGFQGHFLSDCWAILDFHKHHGITKDAAESAALALKLGCDLNCGDAFAHLLEAVERGLIDEATIDVSMRRLLSAKFRLGLFDPEDRAPLAGTPESVIDSPEHRALARETAARACVLLKNNGVLPLDPADPRLFVCGPTAASLDVLLGNYFGTSRQLVSIVEGIASAVPESASVDYRHAYQIDRPNTSAVDFAPLEARGADTTVFVGGVAPMHEGEEGEAFASSSTGDRDQLELPESQIAGLRVLRKEVKNLVLVLTGGSPIALGEAAELADAIVWVGYPGCEGGHAVADVLFGKANPAARLPITWHKSEDDLPPFEDYSMPPHDGLPGRTYRYFQGEPLYPFGFGLSYSTFEYRGLELSGDSASAGQTLKVAVRIANTSDRDGEEVVQLYSQRADRDAMAPNWSLRAFARAAIPAGTETTVTFEAPIDRLAEANDAGDFVLTPGAYTIHVGPCSPGPRGQALGAPKPLETTLAVT